MSDREQSITMAIGIRFMILPATYTPSGTTINSSNPICFASLTPSAIHSASLTPPIILLFFSKLRSNPPVNPSCNISLFIILCATKTVMFPEHPAERLGVIGIATNNAITIALQANAIIRSFAVILSDAKFDNCLIRGIISRIGLGTKAYFSDHDLADCVIG